MFRKILFVALLVVVYTVTHAQYAGWMTGTWKSRSEGTALAGNVIHTLQITDVSAENFTGTKTSEMNSGKIIIAISGAFRARGLYLQNGEVVRKEGQWPDCYSCTEANKMIIRRDSLMLVDSISGCSDQCDGVTFYYRLLSEYDNSTQRYLVDRFGRPADIIGFRPYQQTTVNTTVIAGDTEPLKNDVPAVTTATHPDPELIRQQEKRRRDSLDNITRIKQQQADDSLRITQERKREQQLNDSLHLAKQKEQQRISDSLKTVTRIKQQQAEDSARLVQQKNREQAMADSLDLVKQKEQQRINDSLNTVALLEQRRRQTEDSLRTVQRQREAKDSIEVAAKRQQQLNDSLQKVAINLQKQRTADSLLALQSGKRQQEITDSLASVRQQHYTDSLQKAALAKTIPAAADTILPAADKALTTRTNVLLETYHINSPDILIELFDNGEIDGDRVSVYHNDTIIVNNQMLDRKPITLNIHADAANRKHEFILVAENLGSIPPNSALMRITAGKQSYKLSVNTDLKTNARIVFYYDGN